MALKNKNFAYLYGVCRGKSPLFLCCLDGMLAVLPLFLDKRASGEKFQRRNGFG